MTRSMTAFGTSTGAQDGWAWDWDLRTVNGRGLDVKLRLPEGFGQVEGELRKMVTSQLARGNLLATLRLTRTADGSEAIDADALKQQLVRARTVHAAAEAIGTPMSPLTVAETLALPGVMSGRAEQTEALRELKQPILDSFSSALEALREMRVREGAALAAVLGELVVSIDHLCGAAEALAPERAAHQRKALEDALARITAGAEPVDADRIVQEIALIAVKGDVTEELQRLRIHVDAARALLSADEPIGRKLDFLTQEFNREANTLCSKAQFGPLTQIGLDLKAVIDQMREQVQNLE